MSDPKNKKARLRGEAYAGKGYGTQRHQLFSAARLHIERSISEGFYCEAISIIESIVSDRLESRLSYLRSANFGFKTLGWLIRELQTTETNPELLRLIGLLDLWRARRNEALHELAKVEQDVPPKTWEDRIADLKVSADEGYLLLRALYNRVADLNPRHFSRVFDEPPLQGI